MKKNFLIVTIDALSKWYIDQVKMSNDFWTYLEKETLNFSDMYATDHLRRLRLEVFGAAQNLCLEVAI